MRKINLQLFAIGGNWINGPQYDKKKLNLESDEGINGTAVRDNRIVEEQKKATVTNPSTNTNTNTNSGTQNNSKQLPVSGNGTQLAQSALSKTFTPSASYQQAMNLCDNLLAQITSGKTSYSDQVQAQMDKILNREDFKYDADSDMLFQQYLASSMATGKQAMQDTMGQAAAFTGGYGSTYATSAGNQMYNAYIQDAYANLPEYYQLALEAYQMEGDEMYRQLGMLNDADATEYGRLYNAWSANNTHAQQLYQQEYGQWADGVNNEFNLAQFMNSNYWNQRDDAYRNMTFLADNDVNADGKFDLADQQIINQQKNSSGTRGNGTMATFTREDGTVVVVDVDNIPKTVSTNASKFDNNGELEHYLDSQVEAGIITEEESDYLYITNRKTESAEVPLNERNWKMTDDGGGNIGIDRNAYVVDEFDNPYKLADLFRELKKTMPNKEAREYIEQLQKDLGIV